MMIVDNWYGWNVGDGVDCHSDWVAARSKPVAWALRHSSVLHGMALAARSTRAPVVAITHGAPGYRTLLVVRGLLGRRRKVILLHLIVPPLWRTGLIDRSYDRLWKAVERRCLRRQLVRGHVLTRFERDELSSWTGLAPEAFVFVPWMACGDGLPEQPPAERDLAEGERPLVLAAGRFYCDWATLISAARGQNWHTILVCGANERAAVEALSAGSDVEVRSEIPAAEHDALLAQARVSAVVMWEAGCSQGHTRLGQAVDAGTALVVSGVRAVEDYVADGENALVVAPGDAAAVGNAIARLLTDDVLRTRIRATAHQRGQAWTRHDYLVAIRRQILQLEGDDVHRTPIT